MSSEILSKPFLKWAGGKYKLAGKINENLISGKRLVEPFVGSGAVFMNTSYSQYLLCDTNADLIGLYNNIKYKFNDLLVIVENLFSGEYNTEEMFYKLREEFNTLASDDVRKSAIFVYLNKHAFNGLCRYNSKGKFNVPYGKYTKPAMPKNELLAFKSKADIAEFKCQTFEQTFDELVEGDVVYCDPPYVPLSATSSFTSYASNEFGANEQEKLANCANEANKKNIHVLISNHDLQITRELYNGAKVISFDVKRSIASKAKSRKHVGELLAIF